MFILIKCDGMSNIIILFYYYEIIFLPLICCMKQVKPGNIKGNRSIQKKGLKQYKRKQEYTGKGFKTLYSET
jgi:hypothetical protein